MYPPLALSAAQQRRLTLAALLDQLEALARQKPVLLLFEDAHWADASSLEVLDLAVERVRALPVLVLITFRSPGMPRGRTSTAAAQANAVMRRHRDCSEGRRRLVARSPHGHEQHARTKDATGREPRVPRSYGRYLVAL